LNRRQLNGLEENFKTFIEPLLDGNAPEDYHFLWEWQKFFHSKKLLVLTAEKEGLNKWKEALQSR
jgi:hypothetical protein